MWQRPVRRERVQGQAAGNHGLFGKSLIATGLVLQVASFLNSESSSDYSHFLWAVGVIATLLGFAINRAPAILPQGQNLAQIAPPRR